LLNRFCTLPTSDVSLTVADAPDPIEQGSQLTYTATVAPTASAVVGATT
jgi:hypothetical protein